MKTKIRTRQIPGRTKSLDRTVNDDLDDVVDAEEDAADEQAVAAMLPLLPKRHPK